MNKDEAITIIKSGKFFSCEFEKRTDKSVRKMLARTGVRKGVTKPAKYSFSAHNLISVFDLQNHSFRVIPIEGLIKVNGVTLKK